MDIKIGSVAKKQELVTENNTAARFASGTALVYATPALIGLMEGAAVAAIGDQLPADYSTVGIHLDVSHLAATPIGLTVTATATLIRVDGKKLYFTVTADDDKGIIGKGTHERFIVDSKKFMAKAEAKK